ncbi:efflux RND transporter periplasmic adaptor subunit [Candidatus Poribacteria bacterium]|nr:efflux RND transporter periplasmic adaptor subunit [Candidatus Poribacteria bacterium]
MKKALIIIAIVLVVAIIGGWQISKNRNKDDNQIVQALTAVELEDVSLGTIQDELSLVGNIKATSEVNVFPKVPGKLTDVFVEIGDRVEAGNVLAKIEDKELKLQVRQAEAAVEAAKVGLDQAKSLSEIKIRSQLAQAQAGFSSAAAALKQVKDMARTKTVSQLEQAEAGLEALKANLKKIKEGARSEEKRQIESTVQQAKASLDNAKGDLERMKNLYEEGAISKQSLDATETRATVAQAQYDAALEQLKLVETGAREEDIQAMESQVRQAEAGLELARSSFEMKSWEQDIEMAQGQYDQAKAALDTAKSLIDAESWKAEITAAETALKQANVALELSQEALSNATITAPIDGVISRRFMDKGSMASMSAPLFTIVDMESVEAEVSVIEADLPKISLNRTAYISVESIPEQIKGKISLISPIIKAMSRTSTVEITIKNDDHKLKPGMFAKVTIPIETRKDTIILRRSAVIEDRVSDGKHVFVVNGNISSRREVKAGIVKSNVIEILSGLQVGEKVVVSGQNFLEDGQKVKVINQKNS